MAFGPLQIFAFAFPTTDKFEGRIAAELVKLSDAGVIRIVDALGVFVEGDEVDILRVSDLSEAQREELGAEIGALIGLGAAGLEAGKSLQPRDVEPAYLRQKVAEKPRASP